VAGRIVARVTALTGLTASGQVLVAVAVGSWVLARLVGGRPLYLFCYGLLAFLAVAFLIGRRPLPLEGTRSESRPRLAEGETVTMEVGLTARRRITSFVLREEVPSGLGVPSQVPVAGLAGGETVAHSYRITCTRRGAFQLGPLVARWGDPFGLTQREVVLAEPVEVLVHPATELVSDRPLTRLFEDPPIRPPVSKPWPQGLEFYGMREYAPGDDVRRIVWRAYARTGRLLVRESEQGITDKISLILDTDRRHHSRGDVSESFEAGIKVVASLGTRHLVEGYSVTLEGNEARLIPPLRGAASQMLLLDTLARAATSDATLVDPIMRMVTNPQRDSHVVIVTPRLDQQTAARLQLLVKRGASVLVAALMWDESSEPTLAAAAALGCQVVEVRPDTSLREAFRHEVGAGR
jgi:uncharacterized protein (DUF58 family)